MKKQVGKAICMLTLLFGITTLLYTMAFQQQQEVREVGNTLVLMNEIKQVMSDENEMYPAQKQLEELEVNLRSLPQETKFPRTYIYGYVLLACGYMVTLLVYIYVKILRPFHTLEQYANALASGNLEVALPYERVNVFGAFTWAFDHMRKELCFAKQQEEKAIQDNKTIIATLSHDIKTPIASIRAYAEGLEAGLDSDYITRQRYIKVIMKKCDEVTHLTDDLLLHSLSELQSLKFQMQMIEITAFLKDTIRCLGHKDLNLQEPIPSATLYVDPQRLAQCIENLFSNAQKYAPHTRIDIWGESRGTSYLIHIYDHGPGIAPQDMPFVFHKFYRGANAIEQPGSGLGLYIVDYIMKQMQGSVALNHHEDGLEAVLQLPIK